MDRENRQAYFAYPPRGSSLFWGWIAVQGMGSDDARPREGLESDSNRF
jgi:hypothetical protein